MKAEAKYNPDGPYWEIVVTEPGKPPITFTAAADEETPDLAAVAGEIAQRLADAYNRVADELGLI